MSSSTTTTTHRRRLPVYLYIPNILGYVRILLALLGLHFSNKYPCTTILIWNASAFLDFIDGILARKLKQTSKLGIYLDICADNVLRGACWMAAAQSTNYLVIPYSITCLEWITMVCTLLYNNNNTHWKQTSEDENWLVRQVFENNFRNPLGMLSIYGLFAANQFLYGSAHLQLFEYYIPFYHVWKWLAYTGRVLAMVCEFHFIGKFLKMVIKKEKDEKSKSE